MSPIALVTAAINPPQWVEQTLPMLAILAVRQKADFHVATELCNAAPGFRLSNSWVKFHTMRRLLACGYTRIVWIDVDVIPNFYTLEDKDLFRLFKGDKLTMAVDPMKSFGERGINWLNESGLPKCDRIKHETTYYNSGIFGIPSDVAANMLERWQDNRNHKTGNFHEQDFMNWFIVKDSVPVEVMPRELNWMSAMHNFGDSILKAKLIHLSGSQKNLVTPILRVLSLN